MKIGFLAIAVLFAYCAISHCLNDDNFARRNLNQSSGCFPQGVRMSLGDNFDLNPNYDKKLMLQAIPFDYSITYFTQDECKQNYLEVYSSIDRRDSLKALSPTITYFSQKGETQYDIPFTVYVYEFKLSSKALGLIPNSYVYYSCFYDITSDEDYEESDYEEFSEKGVFKFYHHDYSELKSKPFKFLWIADYDIMPNLEPKYNGRRFGFDNIHIMDEYLKRDREQYVAIFGGGDYAYDLEDDNGQRGAEFIRAIEISYSGIPFVSVAGNHEETNQFSYFKSLFRNQRYSISQSDFFTTSFGELLAVSINNNRVARSPTTGKATGLEQPYYDNLIRWLDDTLTSLAPTHRWIIVSAHQNLYCFEDFEQSYCYKNPTIFKRIEELLLKHKVDIYLAGHVHAYERIHPMEGDQARFNENLRCNMKVCDLYDSPTAPVYVVDGTGGSNHYFPKDNGYPGSNFTVTSSRSLGFSQVTVQNKTHILFEHFLSDGLTVFDSFTIFKPFNQTDPVIRTTAESGQNGEGLQQEEFIGLLLIIALVLAIVIHLVCKYHKEKDITLLSYKDNRLHQHQELQINQDTGRNLQSFQFL